MAKKESSVKVLARQVSPAPTTQNESKSISQRKIDNGFIISTSHCKGDQYSHTEKFSPTPMVLEAESGEEANSGKSSLGDAIDHIKGRV